MSNYSTKLIALLVGLVTIAFAGDYFFGSAKRGFSYTGNFIIWSNVPPAVVVEVSTDLTNWTPVFLAQQVGGTGMMTFGYPIVVTNNPELYTRLRKIDPVPVP